MVAHLITRKNHYNARLMADRHKNIVRRKSQQRVAARLKLQDTQPPQYTPEQNARPTGMVFWSVYIQLTTGCGAKIKDS